VLVAALIAGAAVAHATWNVTVKRAGTTGPGFLWATFVVGAVVFAPFGITSLIQSHTDLLRWLGFASVSGALQVGYFFLLQRVYRSADVSIVYPLARGTGPLLSVILAIVVLGERPGPIVLAGAALVVVGVVVIGFVGERGAARVNRSGVLGGLLIGVVIALYTLWDAAAVTVGDMPPVGLYWGSVVFQLILVAVPAIRGWSATKRVSRDHWAAVLIVGILAPLAYMLVLSAIQLAPVSVVAPAREVSVVLVALAGWLLLHEARPAQRLVGATIVLAGVALLALG
jgi:drug/metabolite transporter (DMT)-like permease